MGEMAPEIREVWAANLVEEFELIGDIVDDYPYIAMDTEYPGVVERVDNSYWDPDRRYEQIQINVNRLELIQLGLTFFDKKGGRHPPRIWEFNFCEFDLEKHEYNSSSIDKLRAAGIDLVKNKNEGVPVKEFVKLLIPSGVLMNSEVTWVTFDGGYDFGYLVKSLRDVKLEDEGAKFMEAIHVFFPEMYDVKQIMKFVQGLHGGLESLAASLGVNRVVGQSHQAGSDSCLTAHCFLELENNKKWREIIRMCKGNVNGLQWYK